MFPYGATPHADVCEAFCSASMKGNNVNLLFTDKNRLVSKLFRNADGNVIQDRTSEI